MQKKHRLKTQTNTESYIKCNSDELLYIQLAFQIFLPLLKDRSYNAYAPLPLPLKKRELYSSLL